MSGASPFRWRGVVEGFYGKPWDPVDRQFLVEQMGRWGMNLYVYAPKNDPLHRDRWREPYPPDAMREFEALVACGKRSGVEIGMSLSPGLSIRYSAREDRAALCEKLRAFQPLGIRFFSLGLDDVPSRLTHEEDRCAFGSLADAHVALTHEVLGALDRDTVLWLVPTDYVGSEPTDYLEALGARLDPAVEVGWTGRTVVSPSIPRQEAARRAATLRRRLLIWDNVPVSDGPMRCMLHLGPFGRRDPRLAEHASGILLNPMEHARASAIAIRTGAAYLADPAGYDPEAAWRAALEEVGEGAPAAFRTFALAHRFSPLWPAQCDVELEKALRALEGALDTGRDTAPVLAELGSLAAARAAVRGELDARLADRRLHQEIGPWLESHARETQCIQAALDALGPLCSAAPRGDKIRALFALELRVGSQAPALRASYGPRRVLYPQLASLRDEQVAFGPDRALFRDRCLADAFVEFAERVALRELELR